MRAVFAAVLFLLCACASANVPDYAGVKDTTLRLMQRQDDGTLICSGTVIGHHLVLTAEHCIAGGLDHFTMNGRTVGITQVTSDGNDHVVLTTDLYFEHVATFGPAPKQGDLIFTHGNPAGLANILSIGYVAGFVDTWSPTAQDHYRDVMILDSADWHGCSGAAIFDAKGRIVGVVNSEYPWPRVDGWHLMAGFGLEFTPAQLQGQMTQAETYAQFAKDLADMQRAFIEAARQHPQ